MCAREAQMKRTPELASRVRPELAETLLEANSSDKLIRWRSGFLRPPSCTEPLKHCAFRSRHTRIGWIPGPSTMNRSPWEIDSWWMGQVSNRFEYVSNEMHSVLKA